MAFLAVLREGLETAVFLLATFQASLDRVSAPRRRRSSASRLAALLGYALYRGGTRINLQRFFTLTSSCWSSSPAGLLMTAAHTAHEAGWLDLGQATALDLQWLVRPGTPWSAVVTGVLGIQPPPHGRRGRRLGALPRGHAHRRPAPRRPAATTPPRRRRTTSARA